MSVQALGWVLDHSPTTGSGRLVLVSLANHAGSSPVDGAWESWPGVERIRREAGLRRHRTVQEAIADLEASGHVERVLNGAPDFRIRADRRPNLYRVLLASGVSCGGTSCQWCSTTPRGDAIRTNGVPDSRDTGCRKTAPEPYPQPSSNRGGRSDRRDGPVLPPPVGDVLAARPPRPPSDQLVAEVQRLRTEHRPQEHAS